MNLKSTFFTGVIVSLIFLGVSCENKPNSLLDDDPVLSENSNQPIIGGELNLIESEVYRNLLPSTIEETVGYRVISQIHNSLLKMDAKNLNIEPCVASSWEVNDEQTKYTFHIRNNVYFHKDSCFSNESSARLKVADIVFTFELLCGELYNGGYNLLMNNLIGAKDFYAKKSNTIEGIKVPDDSTIVFELLEAAPSFIHLFASTKTSIISKVAFEKYGKSIKIGCGPFKFSEISLDSSKIYLTKNQNYFLKDKFNNSLPYLDSVTFLINSEGEDPTSLFLDKEIMILYDLTENKVEDLFMNFNEKFKAKEFVLDRKAILGTDCYEFNTTKAPFNDINVRKAFSYAINRNKIVENILANQGTAGTKGIVPIVETFKNYNYDTITSIEHNPEKAKALLAKAGFPDGRNFPEVVLELSGSGQSIQLEAAKEIQTQLQNILNIHLTIEQESLSMLINRAANGKAQMSHFTWLSEYPSPIDFLNLFYGGNNPNNLNEYIWPNVSRFQNKTYDNTLEKAMVTSDLNDRFNLYAKAESILMDDAPVIVLWYPEAYNIIHGCVKNLYFNEMLHFDYSEVYISK
jgi:peptide/nickel transport system substrate-binding protein